jgi:hypothetical protein
MRTFGVRDPGRENDDRPGACLPKERCTMQNENATRQPVHSYDTEHHRIRCGIPGHTGASKHSASVTCPDCRRLLAERTERPPQEEETAAPSLH